MKRSIIFFLVLLTIAACKKAQVLGQVQVPTPTSSAGYDYDDGFTSVIYDGTWGIIIDPNDYMGGGHNSSTSGSSSQLTFQGTSIQLFGRKGPDFGNADVYIDGKKDATVDSYSSGVLYQQILYSKTGLTNASHTIKIVVSAAKNESSSGYNLVIDKFNYVTVFPQNQISVLSPVYCSKISGNTTIKIKAPGLTSATVKCWKQGSGLGVESTVGTITFDGDGKGSIVFPADNYQHGPLAVRIYGTNGTIDDLCTLQLYNIGGVSWKEGIANNPQPPQAAGMSLVFQDDFTAMPSMSHDGIGKKYATTWSMNNQDGTDAWFADISTPYNPFYQEDSYLRIRCYKADFTDPYGWKRKYVSGTLCSVDFNGNGFKQQYGYFECRMYAQNAKGTWPGWWMSSVSIGSGCKCGTENDIFESWGHGSDNEVYSATQHHWNQDGSHTEESTWINPFSTSGFGWGAGFHNYGLKIAPDTTIFYLDDIEVLRVPTCQYSNQFPACFMFQMGLGAGWPIDLSRYNNYIDTYVDYVRIYQ